jgi:hypothetical protein
MRVLLEVIDSSGHPSERPYEGGVTRVNAPFDIRHSVGRRRRRIQGRRDVAPSPTNGHRDMTGPPRTLEAVGVGTMGAGSPSSPAAPAPAPAREGWRSLPGRRWAAPSLPDPQRLSRGRGVRVTRGALARRSRSLGHGSTSASGGLPECCPGRKGVVRGPAIGSRAALAFVEKQHRRRALLQLVEPARHGVDSWDAPHMPQSACLSAGVVCAWSEPPAAMDGSYRRRVTSSLPTVSASALRPWWPWPAAGRTTTLARSRERGMQAVRNTLAGKRAPDRRRSLSLCLVVAHGRSSGGRRGRGLTRRARACGRPPWLPSPRQVAH